MSHSLSNVRIVSNIYPVTTVSTRALRGIPVRKVGVLDDPIFRLKIKCREAMVILSRLKHGGVNDDRQQAAILLDNHLVSEAQIKAYWDSGRCVACLSGERPIGLVNDGKKAWLECRCEKPNCPVKMPPMP